MANYLLLENGSYLLLESGDKIVLQEGASASLSPSLSPSLSVSLSPSLSLSLSPSPTASSSPSPSPSMGYSIATRGDVTSLSGDTTDLETPYTESEEEVISKRDKRYVGQTGILQYMVHQFKSFVGASTYCNIELEGRSSLAASESTVYLQIFNHNNNEWETIDTETEAPQDVNFELSANIPDLSDYISLQIVTCRVYQYATE